MKNLIAQLLVLLFATASLALFYLSYRPGAFAQPFVSIGLILIGPWLMISLMPVIFILEDGELKREIILQQCLMAAIVVILLSGLAVYYGFHSDILAYLQQLFLKAITRCLDILEEGIEISRKVYDFVKNLLAMYVTPLFQRIS